MTPEREREIRVRAAVIKNPGIGVSTEELMLCELLAALDAAREEVNRAWGAHTDLESHFWTKTTRLESELSAAREALWAVADKGGTSHWSHRIIAPVLGMSLEELTSECHRRWREAFKAEYGEYPENTRTQDD